MTITSIVEKLEKIGYTISNPTRVRGICTFIVNGNLEVAFVESTVSTEQEEEKFLAKLRARLDN